MAKGDILNNFFHSYKDGFTGKKVTRLTGLDNLCHHPYFYNKMFTNDGRYLVYTMEVNGEREFYRMDLYNQSSLQLTDEGGLCYFSANLSGDDKYLYFCRNKSIFRMNMITLEEEIIYSTKAGWWAYDNPALSSDGKYSITIEINERDKIETSSGWNLFEEQWKIKPECRIVLIDIEKKSGEVIYQDKCWLGHPQIRPNHNEDISFCHEGPSHVVDARLWFINIDGSNLRCARPQQQDEMITHEFWLQDGSEMMYVYRIQNQDGKSTNDLVDTETFMPKVSDQDLKQSIMSLDPDTLKETFLMECSKYCHCTSAPDNKKIVGDGQLADEPYIYLADLTTRTEEILCIHGTSWKSYRTNQDSHPHPAFTPDGNKVIFTSDREGLPAIYIVEM
jgi:oligogalacturonide lyase